jgi:hypothetical protein
MHDTPSMTIQQSLQRYSWSYLFNSQSWQLFCSSGSHSIFSFRFCSRSVRAERVFDRFMNARRGSIKLERKNQFLASTVFWAKARVSSQQSQRASIARQRFQQASRGRTFFGRLLLHRPPRDLLRTGVERGERLRQFAFQVCQCDGRAVDRAISAHILQNECRLHERLGAEVARGAFQRVRGASEQ